MARESNEFYFFFGRYNPLSNWYPVYFTYNNVSFPNMESFMMYCKAKLFRDEEIAEQILKTDDPAAVKALGRKVRGYQEEVWSAKRQHFVTTGLVAKFTQNRICRDALLATGDLELVEAARNDTIWGVGLEESNPLILDRRNWRGSNLLGICLMDARIIIRNKQGLQ